MLPISCSRLALFCRLTRSSAVHRARWVCSADLHFRSPDAHLRPRRHPPPVQSIDNDLALFCTFASHRHPGPMWVCFVNLIIPPLALLPFPSFPIRHEGPTLWLCFVSMHPVGPASCSRTARARSVRRRHHSHGPGVGSESHSHPRGPAIAGTVLAGVGRNIAIPPSVREAGGAPVSRSMDGLNSPFTCHTVSIFGLHYSWTL